MKTKNTIIRAIRAAAVLALLAALATVAGILARYHGNPVELAERIPACIIITAAAILAAAAAVLGEEAVTKCK
jgi:hypothetical protein